MSWSERFVDFAPFNRLLAIPILLAQFRRSEHGLRVLLGFFISVVGVLIVSWLIVLFPALPWHSSAFGVPVKDYILQSENFLICAFVVLALAFDELSLRRWRSAAGLAAFAAVFLANIAFVVSGRTAFLVAPVLTLLLGWRQWRWRGLLSAGILFGILGAAATAESPYLRARMDTSATELRAWRRTDAVNSTALHLQFLKEALSFVKTAPIIGHGTGSILEQYRNEAVGETGAAAVVSVNPHNQILAVAIQLGIVGAAVLVAMWVAQFMLFRGGGLIGWIGVVIVADSVVSCLVNSHLFDFTQSWIYIFGIGAAGGTALREAKPAAWHEPDKP
ncbi:MAG: O-antigen ligase family protein, partial [Xanthobacteraceae bacterium]